MIAPLLSFTVENLYAALQRFKIYDSTFVDSSDGEDEMDYSAETSGSESDWL